MPCNFPIQSLTVLIVRVGPLISMIYSNHSICINVLPSLSTLCSNLMVGGLSVPMHTPLSTPHPFFLHPSFPYFFLFFLLSTSIYSSHCVEDALYSFYGYILEGNNISCIIVAFETYLNWANKSTASCCGCSDINKPVQGHRV